VLVVLASVGALGDKNDLTRPLVVPPNEAVERALPDLGRASADAPTALSSGAVRSVEGRTKSLIGLRHELGNLWTMGDNRWGRPGWRR
jgi:hypothetical protein